MNKRMRELAEQAELYAVSENSSMLFDVWKKRYTEKLAELIVRECAYIAELHVMNISTYADAEFVGEQIKQHFGVEE